MVIYVFKVQVKESTFWDTASKYLTTGIIQSKQVTLCSYCGSIFKQLNEMKNPQSLVLVLV